MAKQITRVLVLSMFRRLLEASIIGSKFLKFIPHKNNK